MPLASVVIPVYQRADLLGPCLAALARAGLDDLELVLVDNGSTDPQMEPLYGRWADRATIVRMGENAGFARACNRGAEVARAPVVVLLNSDTEVHDGWLAPLLAATEDPAVGMAASRLLYGDGRVQHAGMALQPEGGMPWHMHRGLPGDHPLVTRTRDLTVVTAACVAIRRDLFLAHRFDEAYRNGFEDVDLCLRLARQGHVARLCGDSAVTHHEGKSPGRRRHEDANARLFAERWAGWPSDLEALLAEDGIATGPGDLDFEGPLFDGSPEARRALDAVVDICAEGFLPVVRETPCGPLSPLAASDCPPEVIAGLNRYRVAGVPPRRPLTSADPVPRRGGGWLPVGWWGPVLGRSGYASAGRGLLAAAARAGRRVVVDPADRVPPGAEAPGFPDLGRQDVGVAAWVLHHIPVAPDGATPWADVAAHVGTACVGATCFESETLPPSWVPACNAMTEIWVPGEFNRGTFTAAGVDPGLIHVVPYPVDTDVLCPGPPAAPDPVFTFLSVFEWTWRKGWDALLRAYVEEFSAEEPVCLRILTYRGGGALGGGDVWTQAVEHLQDLGVDPAGVPDIDLLLDPVSAAGLIDLYRASDAFVLATRGEGAGMPVFEAMACGTPVIATDFGGHADLMTPDLAYPVRVERMVEAPPALVNDNVLYRGQRLADPGVADLRAQMRAVYEDRAEAGRRAARAREAVVERLSVPAVARIIDTRLHGIAGGRRPAVALR